RRWGEARRCRPAGGTARRATRPPGSGGAPRARARRCGGSEAPLRRASAVGGGGGTWGSDAVQQVVDRLRHGVAAAAGEEVFEHLADVGGDVLRVVPVARRAHDV